MNRALYLTAGLFGDFKGMVLDHEPRIRAYCARHGFDYLAAEIDHEVYPWFRINLILDAIRSGGYDFIAWVDADAFPVDMSVDLRTALPEGAWLGMRITSAAPWSGESYHWQTGVFYVRCCPESLAYFEDVLAQKDLGSPDDQDAMMSLILDKRPLGFVTLRHTWNHCPHCDPHDRKPIVFGFHGFLPGAARRAYMLEAAKDYPYEEAI